MSDIVGWLEARGLGQYAQIFVENDIDLEVLPNLTELDLQKLGVSMGHCKKLLKAAGALSIDTNEIIQPTPATAPPPTTAEAERRQLTVMFCDLVGSTTLSEQLDPEDLREVIRAYQNTVAGEITRVEGHVAKYMGDGVLAYFGWPRAHEDEAERAVRGGLAITAAVARLNSPGGEPLAARIGIATGLVVVGDLVGDEEARERAAVGETPNLAARLQALAEAGAVVIADGTRRLVGDLFEYVDLGAHDLKGFTEAVRAWRVISASTAESRFEALHGADLTPMIGREQEIALLLDRWRFAKGGEGQVVLLSGEAGIGKSRITRVLRASLAGEPYTRLRYDCSPYHTNSALYPVIEQLGRAAGFQTQDSAEAKLDKLEAVLGLASDQVSEIAPLIAEMCSLATGERYPPLALTPQAQKTRTLDALVGQLDGLAEHQPVLIVLEDAHWIDPSTTELFELVIEHVQHLAVLLLITFRPEFAPPWAGHAHVTTLTLNRLGRNQGAAMVARLTGDKALPAEVLDQILAKTDGVPLFIEELTKTVLESGLLTDVGDRYALTGPLVPFAIPVTLQDSLMARLDRLSTARVVAQTGAVIGREFSHELVAVVIDRPEAELVSALDQLVASELIFRRGTQPDATYRFKHALVQDAAYQSLLKSKRQQLHARIASVLEEHSPETTEAAPELLAHHYMQAGDFEIAIEYLERAGNRAIERSANIEGIGHLQQALRLNERLPHGTHRDKRELRLQLMLGPSLMATRGWGEEEVRRTYERAQELCRLTGDDQALFPATWGMWMHYQARADHYQARELTRELLVLAETSVETSLRLQSDHATWTTCLFTGELESAIEHCQSGLALYDMKEHGDHAFSFAGHDPGVCGHAQGALMLWLFGQPDQAAARSEAAIELARQLGHGPSLAHALRFAARTHSMRRNFDAVDRYAQACLDLAEKLELALALASGLILRGWAMAFVGHGRESLEQIERGFAVRHRIQAVSAAPHYLALQAEAQMSLAHFDEAEQTIANAIKLVEDTGERYWAAELYRLRGEIRQQLARSSDLECADFNRALEISRSQKAKSLELRAAMSLARLWQTENKTREAHDLLFPVYDWFTEGFDTKDLKEAKALLDELA
jgi:predicted ATPase/class 3 adenylate cyclase